MRLSRLSPRFTVRRLMVAVAIIGLMISGLELERRREFYLDVRDKHKDQASPWTEIESHAKERLPNFSGETRQKCIEYINMICEYRAYHEKLVNKYNQAALNPWRPVEADSPAPPEPEKPIIIRCQ